jgi:hypothetical protein
MELEKQILVLSSKLETSENLAEQLQERIEQEISFKDEYHKQFKRAHFDLEKVETRYNEEKANTRASLETLDKENQKLKKESAASLVEIEKLKDENHRLRNTIVNKDSQN